eukprot:9990299-Heterocapsa_arctica.AAC.1
MVHKSACSSNADNGHDVYSRRVPEASANRIPTPHGDASVIKTQGTAKPVSLMRLEGVRCPSKRSLRIHANGNFARDAWTRWLLSRVSA